MWSIHYVGLDVHKKMVAFCVKTADGTIVEQGMVAATREALTEWALRRTTPWIGVLETTLFAGWIYDHLEPYAVELKMAQSRRLEAIASAKKKNDHVDAAMLADLLRCNLVPECYVLPRELRDLRVQLRVRNFLLQQAVRLKNRLAGLLMESGEPYNKQKLHQRRYFGELLDRLEHVPEPVLDLLKTVRGLIELFDRAQAELLRGLVAHPDLQERVRRLMTIPGVGQVTALTWALEVGEPERFASVRKAISYCGLCSAQDESGGHSRRGPLSKQRNAHLQTVLIEAAKLAPRWNPWLAQVHQEELARGSANRATVAVARKLVALLLAIDKRGTDYEDRASAVAA
jgi:transposase